MDNINWLGHASFSFLDLNGNKIYFVDPFELKNRSKEKADIIFITHAHPDHFSQEDIDEIIKPDTFIVATSDVLDKLSVEPSQKIKVEPNKNYIVKGFPFKTVPAYNTHPQKLGFHPKQNNWVGYIFNLNGLKIYHAGDTDFIEEMKNLNSANLDIAMLPIGGTYTMDWQEGAEAANTIAAKITIPMHYKKPLKGSFKEAEEEFKKAVKNSKVVILEELA